MLVKALLARQQAFLQRAVLLFQLQRQGLQALGQQRQRVGLALHQAEGFVALVRGRVGAQRGGDAPVQPLAGQQPFAPRQCRQQPQHGRCRHARQRCAKGHAQPFDRRRQRGAHGGQVGCAFQRHAGAAQGDHHAGKGAQHAQQHQQAGQIGREGRRGQAGAFALYPLAHHLAQRGVDLAQPVGQRRRGFRQLRQRVRQAVRGLAVAQQLDHADHKESADQRGDGQRQRVAAGVARAHPQHGGQAGQHGKDERGG